MLPALWLTLSAFLPLALAGRSSGCGKPLPAGLTPGQSTHNITIESKSVLGKTTNRTYILHLPQNYGAANNVAANLILAFHGQQQPAWSMEQISGLSDPAFNQDWIVAYPEGMNVQAPGVQWLGDPAAPPSTRIDDRIFVSELLAHLHSSLCTNPSNTFAAGLSNGGGLTGLLMCDPALNTAFAAFATVSGAFYPDASLPEHLFGSACQPGTRSLRYINYHGLADTIVAYNGSNSPPPDSIPVREWVQGWAARGACVLTADQQPVADANVTETSWECQGVKEGVVHRAIAGFGHGWPSIKNQGEPFETLRNGPTTWDATPEILRFFDRFSV